ncbi:MAG: MmcQ/YjbR family DNA-binding protein [Erysipelotrichaceae bacterium]|nr:MmcQ/YjbR family DNA-binding protein [Erysipelotrichaceae bacterium]
MEIEKEVFRRHHPSVNKLKAYGFVLSEDRYLYTEDFLDDAFRAEISVSSDGEVKGRVIEKELDEEYVNIYSDSYYGDFVGKVREAYIEILEKIRDRCFEKDPYLHRQTARIVSYMKKEYGTRPEHLWEKYPDYAVFRNPNGKWYGIIMSIDGAKIGLEKRETEIINVKSDPNTIASLLNEKGFHEAYHMNKENWISIELNDSVDDEVLFSLIDYSYHMIEESDVWIVPANPKFYDVISAFEKEESILWKQSSDIHVGDIVYLYVAAPYSAILYQCMAEETDIPYSYQDRNLSISRLMRIRRLKTYPQDRFPFSYLNSLGIKAIRGPRRISKRIYEKLN